MPDKTRQTEAPLRNEYLPDQALVLEVRELAPGIRHFVLEFVDPVLRENFSYCSGQFLQVSLLGIGESPISICSPPTQKGSFELCVRETGNLTQALHRLQPGDSLWVRGTLWTGFPAGGNGRPAPDLYSRRHRPGAVEERHRLCRLPERRVRRTNRPSWSAKPGFSPCLAMSMKPGGNPPGSRR